MGKKQAKTNAVRILEQAGAEFETLEYELPEGTEFSGAAVSALLGLPPESTFKTLCARGRSGKIFVFTVPVDGELELKKAAMAAGEKSVELVHVRELRGLTGYERGAVSPVGMQKSYPVFIDETAQLFDRISVSGGAHGLSVLLPPETLRELVGAKYADLT